MDSSIIHILSRMTMMKKDDSLNYNDATVP